MQNCKKDPAQLSAYLDGELEAPERKKLEAHLRSCSDCQKTLALLKTMQEALGEDLPTAPAGLREGIAYKVGLESRRRRLYFGAFGRWTAVAAVLCLVLFGVVRLTGGGMSGASKAAPAAVPAGGAAVSSAASGGSTGGSAPAEDSLTAQKNASVPDAGGRLESAPMPAPMAPADAAPDAAMEPLREADSEEEFSYSSGVEAETTPMATSAPAPGSAPAEFAADALWADEVGLQAVQEGNWYGVLVFCGALPEGVSQEDWAMQTPREGELGRWLLPAEELRELMDSGLCDEVYFGDLMAGQGLAILVAGKEE